MGLSENRFLEGTENDRGYLRPRRRTLPDLVVTRRNLGRGLSVFSRLSTELRKRGSVLRIAQSSQGLHRLPTELDLAPRGFFENVWQPNQPTVASIGGFNYGFSIYEALKEMDAIWIDLKPMSLYEARTTRPDAFYLHGRSSKLRSREQFPCGKLVLTVYSPHRDMTWSRSWSEEEKPLSKQISEIIFELEAAASENESLLAARCAELLQERQAHQIVLAEQQRAEDEVRLDQARSAAFDDLVQTAISWKTQEAVAAFLTAAEETAFTLKEEDREAFEARLGLARGMLQATSPAQRLLDWPSDSMHELLRRK